ncbi:hypothetical protein [Endozoicomonas sp. ALD040]|uniref:hypothetical protein n=1 Tax=Endozoicomonas sp. ALD040 TaxID=3403079 RepID=UPI003BAF4B62
MEASFQKSCTNVQSSSTSIAKASVTETEDATSTQRIVAGRAVSALSGKPFRVSLDDFTTDSVTGQKDQKEIGISSRAVALDPNTSEASQRKHKRLFTDAGDIALRVKPKASLPRSLTKFKANPGGNTAILNQKQVELIQKVFDGRSHELSEEEFKSVIDYFSRKNFRNYVPQAYLESPALMKEFLRNGILKVYEIPKNKLTKDILLSKSSSGIGCCDFDELPDELKTDFDFLIEYSARKGIPFGTPPELAVLIYDHLDITEKIKSLNQLPDSFKNKNDDFYDELIHSGKIALEDLPEHVKSKNKEYCLSQLSKGLCELSEVPVHLLTKESILDSIKGIYYGRNFSRVFFDEYKVFIKDSVFFEEVLVRAVTADLERVDKYDASLKYSSGELCMMQAYDYASKRYKSDAN